jgi:hypothetical protein
VNAQADFGEAVVVIGSIEQKAHFFWTLRTELTLP